MSKRDEHDVADALLAKASGDEAGLRTLVDHPDVPDHVALTPWAVEFRYADPFEAPPLDRADALETVVAVREWATRVIGAEEPGKPQPDSSSETETPAGQ